jgi:hypothetical protein
LKLEHYFILKSLGALRTAPVFFACTKNAGQKIHQHAVGLPYARTRILIFFLEKIENAHTGRAKKVKNILFSHFFYFEALPAVAKAMAGKRKRYVFRSF